MKRVKPAVALLFFLLLLLPSGLVFADGEQGDASVFVETVQEKGMLDQADNSAGQIINTYDDGLLQQIEDTYKAAKKRAHRSSFKGYCGSYVANQLVVLGINTTYLSANGNNTFELYRDMDYTSGGYRVTAYRAKEYSLGEALSAILEKEPEACNVLVGFQKGTSSAGKKYGHVLFIHGIQEGKIYYSDSSSRTVGGVKYKEGEPIVCSMDSFLEEYAGYKLDGVVHFRREESVQKVQASGSSITEVTMEARSEKLSALN